MLYQTEPRPDTSVNRYSTLEMPKLEAIWVKRSSQGRMDPIDAAKLEAGLGLAGNANRSGRRQITIISTERWKEICAGLAAEIPPSTRRANLMVSGLDLENSRGRILRVGSARLRINGETRPCWQMEEAHAGLQAAMKPHWGGGAFAEVLDGGEIRTGDPIEWDSPSKIGTGTDRE